MPHDQRAFANSQSAREVDEPGGMKMVEFAPTEPLASEVVSFAVGPFDTRQAPQSGRRQIAVRVITPKGHAAEGDEAAIATPDILNRLEEYTGIAYPFDKLDQVAIPQLPFGAVENPGLITYRMQAILTPPGKATDAQRRGVRRIESHEMAHQWFGDLVTQSSWEDVWLSEGFATWLSAKIMDQDEPAARRHLSSVVARERIMVTDDSAKTRPVRLVMKDDEMMKDVYSGFVYQKGAAVLAMLEGWLGENAFRAGLHSYLNGHRFGNATTSDLAAALRLTSGIDPADVMYDFLDQTGVPTIRSEVRCEPGVAPHVIFDQENAVSHWDVPVCWKTNSASGCIVINGRRQVELPQNASCPAWVMPNLNGSGYYRTLWTAEQLANIDGRALAQFTAPERLTLVNDVSALRRTGKLDGAAAEALLKRLVSDVEPEIAQAAGKGLPK